MSRGFPARNHGGIFALSQVYISLDLCFVHFNVPLLSCLGRGDNDEVKFVEVIQLLVQLFQLLESYPRIPRG